MFYFEAIPNLRVDDTNDLVLCSSAFFFIPPPPPADHVNSLNISNPRDITYEADEDVYEYLRCYEAGRLQSDYKELNDFISEAEVHKSIKELKCGKSAGPDLLLNELYVFSLDILLSKLTCLFNAVFRSSHFPLSWQTGLIVPLHKKGDTDDVNNYRGITLLSTLGKLFTRILNNRLTFWSSTYHIISDVQSGFCKGRSTLDNLFILQSIIDSSLGNNNKVYCATVDFKKAFDFINRDCLWYKLLKSGIRGNMYNIINSMYSNNFSTVKHQGCISEPFECRIGVRQGESLSPFLFSIFLNDLEIFLQTGNFQGIDMEGTPLKLLLYADDLFLLSSTREDLQLGLDLLYDYCTRWRLYVSTDKTTVVIFRKGGNLSFHDHFFYGHDLLKVSESVLYLGLTLSSRGKFLLTQRNLADRGLKAVYKLLKDTHDLYDPDLKFMCSLYDKLILPVVHYNCEIWGFHAAREVERTHLLFCKKILKLNSRTADYFIYGELGRYPLKLNRHYCIIKYWLNVVNGKCNRLVSKAYNMLYKKCESENPCENWAFSVKRLLCQLGFNYIWLSQGCDNVGPFLRLLKQRLNDVYITQWNEKIHSSTDGIMYRSFKLTPHYSSYFNVIKVSKYRQAMVKFITKNNNIPVVSGKWQRPRPYHQRLCEECELLGNEYHFLFMCKRLKALRSKYISRYFWTKPSMNKFIELLSSEHSKTINNLAIFVYSGLEVFANL